MTVTLRAGSSTRANARHAGSWTTPQPRRRRSAGSQTLLAAKQAPDERRAQSDHGDDHQEDDQKPVRIVMERHPADTHAEQLRDEFEWRDDGGEDRQDVQSAVRGLVEVR